MVGFRALVIDDSRAMRRSLVSALRKLGADACDEAQDGAEGLRKFVGGAYDIVLTDINMPVLDGLKLIHHIRLGGHLPEVPILVISTEATEEDRSRAASLGANAYLVKPVRAERVSATVRGLLGLA